MKSVSPGSDLEAARRAARATEPLYRLIKKYLKERILAGDYAADQQLPSENQLMKIFDVSRVTVRQALHQLQKERLIVSRQGKGYFVARAKAVQDLARLQGLGEAIADTGFSAHSAVLDMTETAADGRVAEALAVEPGATVVRLRRVRHINHQPVSYDVSYFPIEIGRRLKDFDLVRNDVFVLLEEKLGYPLGIADLKIEADKADEALAHLLDMDAGTPVLRIERLTSDETGRPIDFEYLHGRGDAYQFRIRVPRW
jgi:GntR family transcriptional regulator